VRLLLTRERGWTAVLRPRTARCGRWPHRRRGQRGATRSATEQRRYAGRCQRRAHRRTSVRRNRRQRAGPVRRGADPPGLVATTRGLHHRRRCCACDARAWRAPSRRCELTAAAGQSAAGDQGPLRSGGARLGRNVGTRRPLSVAGTVASRAAAALEEPARGRRLDLPVHRSRGDSLGRARSTIRPSAETAHTSKTASAASTEGQRNSCLQREFEALATRSR
jgi:hypothetical protein